VDLTNKHKHLQAKPIQIAGGVVGGVVVKTVVELFHIGGKETLTLFCSAFVFTQPSESSILTTTVYPLRSGKV